MANEPVQAGDEQIVGFGSYSWTGYTPEDGMTEEITYEAEEKVLDLNGNVMTKVRTGEVKRVAGTFTVDSAATVYGIKPGDVVSFTPPGGTSASYEVESWSVASNRATARVSCSLVKEAAMTYA